MLYPWVEADKKLIKPAAPGLVSISAIDLINFYFMVCQGKMVFQSGRRHVIYSHNLERKTA